MFVGPSGDIFLRDRRQTLFRKIPPDRIELFTIARPHALDPRDTEERLRIRGLHEHAIEFPERDRPDVRLAADGEGARMRNRGAGKELPESRFVLKDLECGPRTAADQNPAGKGTRGKVRRPQRCIIAARYQHAAIEREVLQGVEPRLPQAAVPRSLARRRPVPPRTRDQIVPRARHECRDAGQAQRTERAQPRLLAAQHHRWQNPACIDRHACLLRRTRTRSRLGCRRPSDATPRRFTQCCRFRASLHKNENWRTLWSRATRSMYRAPGIDSALRISAVRPGNRG